MPAQYSHCIFWLLITPICATTGIAETTSDRLTVDSLFQQLHDQLQPGDGYGPPASRPDFEGMIEDGNRQLRESVEKRPGHAFGSDELISFHQGSRYMTLRLDEGLGDNCPAPTIVRLPNQTVSAPLQMEQFLGGEWDLLAFYNAEACRVLDVELVRPGMADFVIEHQLEY